MSPHASALSLSARTRNPTARSTPLATLPALAGDVLLVLYQHRIATTGQLQQLLTPDASYLRRVLRKTTAAGLVDFVRHGSAGHRAWFLTAAGYTVVEASGEVEIRAHRVTPALAAGALLAHRLAVVDTGTAFVTAARQAPGDGCTPWAWAPEVLLQPGRRRGGALIADAVLRYERAVDAGVWLITVLIDVDRGTYPVVRLARKMVKYAAWWRTPHRRTHRADRLIVVVDLPTAAAEYRIAMLGALLRQEPATAATTLPIACVALSALIVAGPWAPVFVDALDATQTPVDLRHVGR
jgi:hypothetical protein